MGTCGYARSGGITGWVRDDHGERGGSHDVLSKPHVRLTGMEINVTFGQDLTVLCDNTA